MPYSDRIADDVSELIGRTPLVRLKKVVKENDAEVIAKVEYFNPGGSVKDRACFFMIRDAEEKGLLKPHYTIIEPTSGNTGIGLAMIAAIKGYKCIFTIPETMSLERIYILKAYGAEVVLTPGDSGIQGAIKKAEELHRKIPDSYMPDQFTNTANVRAHRETTAREIVCVTGNRIDAFVAGVGTGGTITGVGEVLKEKIPGIKIVAVEPEKSAVLSGKKPGPHRIQGIGAGVIPELLNRNVIDRVIPVSDENAFEMAGRLAREEGLFVGISSGAAAWAGLVLARELGPGKRVVVVFPDTGERYFSTQQYFGM